MSLSRKPNSSSLSSSTSRVPQYPSYSPPSSTAQTKARSPRSPLERESPILGEGRLSAGSARRLFDDGSVPALPHRKKGPITPDPPLRRKRHLLSSSANIVSRSVKKREKREKSAEEIVEAQTVVSCLPTGQVCVPVGMHVCTNLLVFLT